MSSPASLRACRSLGSISLNVSSKEGEASPPAVSAASGDEASMRSSSRGEGTASPASLGTCKSLGSMLLTVSSKESETSSPAVSAASGSPGAAVFESES
jgi:hypothetical protein